MNREDVRRDRRRRSPGVMLRGRAAGLGRWDDEISADGGKAKLHRQVRRTEARSWRAEAENDMRDFEADLLEVDVP